MEKVIQEGVVITPGSCVAITPGSYVALTPSTKKNYAGMTAIRPSTRKFLIFKFFEFCKKFFNLTGTAPIYIYTPWGLFS